MLIQDGVLTDYMWDLLRSRKEGRTSSGNGRRQSYQYLPMVRMTNTYLLAGTVFGFTLVKSEAASWYRIMEMFYFQSFHMYGVFASALAVAAPSMALIRAYREAGRGADAAAEAHGQQSLALARELGMAREHGQALRTLGETALAALQHDEARRLLDESYAVLREAGDEYEGARTQLALAELHHRRQIDDETAAALAACSAVFERLGAEADLARARRLQADAG